MSGNIAPSTALLNPRRNLRLFSNGNGKKTYTLQYITYDMHGIMGVYKYCMYVYMSVFVGLPLPITLINNRSVVFKSSVWSFESFGPKYLGQDLDGRGAMAAALVSLCQAAWDRCVQNLYENCHRLLPYTRSKLNIETLRKNTKKNMSFTTCIEYCWTWLQCAAIMYAKTGLPKHPKSIPVEAVLSIVRSGCNHAFENESLRTPQRNPQWTY